MFQLLKIKKYTKNNDTSEKNVQRKRLPRGPRMCDLRGHESSPTRWFNNYFISVIFIRCLFLNESRMCALPSRSDVMCKTHCSARAYVYTCITLYITMYFNYGFQNKYSERRGSGPRELWNPIEFSVPSVFRPIIDDRKLNERQSIINIIIITIIIGRGEVVIILFTYYWFFLSLGCASYKLYTKYMA